MLTRDRERGVTVLVYGRLAERLGGSTGRRQQEIHVDQNPGETLTALLTRLGIEREQLYTVFLNGSLLTTRNGMAPWLRYPQAQEDVWDWERDVTLQDGDRVGLFGEDMALLVV